MKLTILGCSGSLGAPGNPGSSYLVSTEGNPDIVMDFGPGALAAMQERGFDPAAAHVVFSHLHADHCSDIASLLVWRRYHPDAPARTRHRMYGPSYTPQHVGVLGADGPGQPTDMSDTFDFAPWVPGEAVQFEGVTVTPYTVVHPAQEPVALRVEDARGKVITYSGDTGWTPALVEAAKSADILLCEAAWGPTPDGRPEGMHLSGQEAGRVAREGGVEKLVLVHIQPWSDPQATLAAAKAEFDGEVVLGKAGDVFEL